jgi:hypothetical protein
MTIGDRRRPLLLATVASLVLVGLSVPVVVALVGRTSSASFADTEVLAANHLGAAELELTVTGEGRPPAEGAPLEALFSAANLAPGDSVSGFLRLRNTGDLALRFGLSATTDGGALGRWLRFEAWIGNGSCAPGQPGPRLVENVALSSTPTVLVDMASPSLGSVLVLEPGQSRVLCLGAELPIDTPNVAQGQRVDVTLLVPAQQSIEVGP